MVDWKKISDYAAKHIPKQSSLKETLLYRMIGEKLFNPELWKPTRRSIAGGLALGVFIALTPTVGAQMFISGLAAYFLKVNMPVAVACAWITNPVTIPIIYPLQYKLGILLSGHPSIEEMAIHGAKFRTIIKYAKPLWIGSTVSAAFFASLSYILVNVLWGSIEKLISKQKVTNEDV